MTFTGEPEADTATLSQAFASAPDKATKAAIMDLYDAKYGTMAAARVLGFIQ